MSVKKSLKTKYKRILSFLVALCLTAGLVSFMPVPVQAANYWTNWTELSSRNIVEDSEVSRRTLTNANFKVTSNTTIETPAADSGHSGLVISGTVTIYIAPGVTLTVTGASGGGAGINLPSGATLILRGGGTVIARGGAGADGVVGVVGGNATNAAYPQGGVADYRGWTFQSGGGGRGGRGAGSGGAGIGGAGAAGGNGGAGGAAVTGQAYDNSFSGNAGTAGSNGAVGNAMGTLYVMDSVAVTATVGASGSQGGGGGGGISGTYRHSSWGTTTYTSGGGGGGGGAAGSSAAIGGSGGGGGGGGGGSSGTGRKPPVNVSASGHVGRGGSGGGASGGAGTSGTTQNRWDGHTQWNGTVTLHTQSGNAGDISRGTFNGNPAASNAAGGAASPQVNFEGRIHGGVSGTYSVRASGAGGTRGNGGAGGTVYVLTTRTVSVSGGGVQTNGSTTSRTHGVGTGATRQTSLTNHLITYEANGENVSGMPANGRKFNNVTEFITNVTPTRRGHTFIGWNTDASATTANHAANAAYTANAALTLYAIWESTFNAEAIVDDQTTDNFNIESNNLHEVLEEHFVTDADRDYGNTVKLTLSVSETCDETAEGAEKIIVQTRGRLLQFFDVTVTKQINDDPVILLSELPVPIQVAIDLSPELSGKTGYTVYRYHGSEVQLLGMDTDADEYFTIRRGGGADGVDRIIIYARNFSLYAVVENIKTLIGADIHDDVDVQARIVDLTTPVYRIDIAWGNMKFIYHTADYAGDWDPDNKTYDNPVAKGWSGFENDNNEIKVWNHSNADVLVDFDVTDNFDDDGTVTMSVEAAQTGIAKVPHPGVEALSMEAFLLIEGIPSSADITRLTNDIWHKIGIITVTITPDGDTLTPLR